MYLASRGLCKLAVLAWLYALLILAALGWPWSGLFMGGLVLAVIARWKVRRLTTLGSARFADQRDLQRAGILDASCGLILGKISLSPQRWAATWSLFQRRVDAKQACQRFWDVFRRDRTGTVRLSQAIHTAVFAPSGAGKGVSLIVPFLLDCPESCVVVDFKGENAKLTAEHRRRAFGHRIVLLDPFQVVTKSPDTFNPLDAIGADSPYAIEECNDLAKALVVRAADEKEPHWNDSAEAWVAAMLATVVRYGDEEGLRSLQTVRDLLSSPERIDMAIQVMRESDCWEGMLARMGGQLANFVDREKSSTLSTVLRHLRFLDAPAISASTATSSFDPARLLVGNMTVYLILPPEHMRAQSALLRTWIGSFLRTIVQGGLRTRKQIHFVLDEAASLGNLEAIEDAVDKFRGYGVRLQFYYQSLGQLKKCFPNGQEQTLLSNTSQVFFGVNDMTTAEMVSARLGEYTVIVESGGTSDGTSWQRSLGAQSQDSLGHSYNTSSNWQQQARKLLKPEEVIALPARVAISFVPGVPPIWTRLLRYYEEPSLARRAGWLANSAQAAGIFAGSLLLCAVSLGLARLLTQALLRITGM